MTDRELRKTVVIPNLSMLELQRQFPLHEIAPGGCAKVEVMEDNEWGQDDPTRDMPTQPPVARDPINPEYYKAEGMEVIQIIEAFKLDYHRASALKYLLRAGSKDNELQDMKKCAWFVNRSIQRLEGKK